MDRIRTLERPTLVFYTHDNGSPLASDNRPFRGAKKQLWQGGIQEPLLAWGPGIVPAGRTVDAVADVKDILPTVADVTDLPVPAGVDGRSLVPLWQGRELPNRTLFWNTPERWFAAREGNWKFHLHPDGRTELYNLATDRHEDRNLAPAMPGKVAGMRAALAAWRADVGR
jgi:arylsulfatase A-like enzyme